MFPHTPEDEKQNKNATARTMNGRWCREPGQSSPRSSRRLFHRHTKVAFNLNPAPRSFCLALLALPVSPPVPPRPVPLYLIIGTGRASLRCVFSRNISAVSRRNSLTPLSESACGCSSSRTGRSSRPSYPVTGASTSPTKTSVPTACFPVLGLRICVLQLFCFVFIFAHGIFCMFAFCFVAFFFCFLPVLLLFCCLSVCFFFTGFWYSWCLELWSVGRGRVEVFDRNGGLDGCRGGWGGPLVCVLFALRGEKSSMAVRRACGRGGGREELFRLHVAV